MAIAKITVTCSECGAEFEHRQTRRNRREADQYEAWAAKNITICPDCLRKIRAAEAAAKAERIIAELNIPTEITGASEKQIAYAIARRNEYLVNHRTALTKVAERLQQFREHHDEIMTAATQAGLTERDVTSRVFEHYAVPELSVILTSTSAREILDALN